jgi:hypothetical protein
MFSFDNHGKIVRKYEKSHITLTFKITSYSKS